MDLFHFQLGQHPFVREGLRLEDSSLILALTSNLTESQELAKEIKLKYGANNMINLVA